MHSGRVTPIWWGIPHRVGAIPGEGYVLTARMALVYAAASVVADQVKCTRQGPPGFIQTVQAIEIEVQAGRVYLLTGIDAESIAARQEATSLSAGQSPEMRHQIGMTGCAGAVLLILLILIRCIHTAMLGLERRAQGLRRVMAQKGGSSSLLWGVMPAVTASRTTLRAGAGA